jgi:predicted P-loop ATPase
MSATPTIGRDWSVLGMPSDARDHAARLVKFGLHPIEIYGLTPDNQCRCEKCAPDDRSRGKHPMFTAWQKSKLDPVKLDKHLADGRRNLGLRMGPQPNGDRLIALDVEADGMDDGKPVALAPLVDKYGELPATLTARTGSGGMHLVFRWPDGVDMPSNGVKIVPNVDIRSDRGQIVVAPSKHYSGGSYAWTRAVEPAELPAAWVEGFMARPEPAPAPAPTLALVTTRATEPSDNLIDRARAYIATMPPAISGQGGHAATWNVARKVVCDFGIDEQRAFILLCDFNLRCVPPWTDKELRHKIKEAVTRGKVRNPIQDRSLVMTTGTALGKAWTNSEAAAGLAPSVPGPDGSHDAEIVPKTEAVQPGAEAWRKMLRHNQAGAITKDVGNVVLILKNAPGFQGALAYNEMSYGVSWVREPSYDVGFVAPLGGEALVDEHGTYVSQVLAYYFNLSVGDSIVWKAMLKAAHEQKFHPVRDYLDGLQWDGVERLSKWLHTYLGCEDTEYNSAIGRWWLISAVARGYRPGCQVDHVLVLEGGQGKGKSQAVKALGDPWVLENLPDIRDQKATAEVIGDQWIIELAELDAIKGAGVTKIKSFITQQFDKYRPAYAHATVKRPRPCVFVATTNEYTYLIDPTGARRFWPTTVGTIDLAALRRDRDQLWAEARALYRGGDPLNDPLDEPWWPSEALKGAIQEQQEARRQPLPWEEKIAKWVAERGIKQTTVTQVLSECIVKDSATWNKADDAHVTGCLKAIGFKQAMIWDKAQKKEIRGWRL